MNTFQNTYAPTFSEPDSTKDERNNFPLSPVKTLQELNLMDGFLFNAATEQDESAIKIARTIIQRVTGIMVDQIEIEREKPVAFLTSNQTSIRNLIYLTEAATIRQ